MHDGQNVLDARTSFAASGVDETLDSLHDSGAPTRSSSPSTTVDRRFDEYSLDQPEYGVQGDAYVDFLRRR